MARHIYQVTNKNLDWVVCECIRPFQTFKILKPLNKWPGRYVSDTNKILSWAIKS